MNGSLSPLPKNGKMDTITRTPDVVALCQEQDRTRIARIGRIKIKNPPILAILFSPVAIEPGSLGLDG